MPHTYLKKKSRNFLSLKILEIYEFNNEPCSISELKGYYRKELQLILSRISFRYINIDKKSNIYY